MLEVNMKAIISNHEIIIQDFKKHDADYFRNILTYIDKSKQYQLKKMAKNPFLRKLPAYTKLQQESTGCLLIEQDTELILPSGFYHLIIDKQIPYEDKRCETGDRIFLPWVTKPFDLREYQEEAVTVIENNYRGVIELATGLGKTLIAIHAIRRVGKKALVICPNKSIARQFHDQLKSAFGSNKIGFAGDGHFSIKDVTVGIAATVHNKIDEFKKHNFGLIITDETHHIAANTFYTIAQNLAHTGKMFGLTATAFRNDGKDMFIEAYVGKSLLIRDAVWGIQNKFLANPVFIMRKFNSLQADNKDKLKAYKSHILNNKKFNDKLVNDINSFLAAGKKVLVLCDMIEHAQYLGKQVGLPAAVGIDNESLSYIDQLNNDKIQGVIATDSFIGEGSDTKKVDVLFMVNFVASKGTVLQNIGRGLRKYDGKEHLIVIDYLVQNSDMLKRHAMLRYEIYKTLTENVKMKEMKL